MFISSVQISNYRLFPTSGFKIDSFNIPDGQNEGKGITVFVGENGCGKTSILEAISLPLLTYKAEGFALDDLNDPKDKTHIEILGDKEFFVNKVVRGTFKAKGFLFDGGLRNRGSSSYLVTLTVGDQKFIPSDSETIEEGSSDLRVNVNNPWKGPRFRENDILFLDKNRTFQIRTGTYNQTRFDKLMEDFNFQYVDAETKNISDISSRLGKKVKANIENDFLKKAIDKFMAISGIKINLELLKNHQPFEHAFFGQKKRSGIQVELNKTGSGYEMVFALLYSFYLSQQGGKQQIIIIDEPELHLHPTLQKGLVDVLLEISKASQIILTTQSPLFVKYLSQSKFVKFNIISKSKNKIKLSKQEERVLPLISANEINFVAFGLPTNEYHLELYGYLHEKYIDAGDETERGDRSEIANFDKYLSEKLGCEVFVWKRLKRKTSLVVEENRTIHTCIRNKIDHPNNTLNDNQINFDYELPNSIKFLRKKIKSKI